MNDDDRIGSWQKLLVLGILLAISLFHASPISADESQLRVAEQVLVDALHDGDSPTIRIRAARALVRLDYWSRLTPDVWDVLENDSGSEVEYAQLMIDRWYFEPSKRDEWIDRLIELAMDDQTRRRALMVILESRLDVATLAEADVSRESREMRQRFLDELRRATRDHSEENRILELGVLASLASQPKECGKAIKAIASSVRDEGTAAIAMVVLAQLAPFDIATVEQLGDDFRPNTASASTESRISQFNEMIVELIQVSRDLGNGESTTTPFIAQTLLEDDAMRPYAAVVLANIGTDSELDALRSVVDDPSAETVSRIESAYAIFRIHRRESKQLNWLDWLVIASYGFGMIAIGVYYAMRTRDTEDYLLGGRRMLPSMVGLSMFASLLSTLSYLAQPGEVIRNGPMTIVQLVAYPFVFVVVGWCLIPSIMKLNVTSGYEMLEQRLGTSCRLLGSTIFLVLRLLWMATIIYVTTSTVLIPMIGWPQSMTPVICLVIGVITIVYTSLGGLRAVVVTDAIQTLILFGGAVLAIAIITLELGGVSEWWPQSWYSHWQEPVWFDPSVRTSFLGLFLAMFTWQVFTNGSDQMAIQRYLATRDAPAARRVLLVSLVTGSIVMTFLVCLGLALLAFMQSNPVAIPDDKTLLADADKMLPSFIVRKLPAGVAGLVIAGLLAAAMSSLSSGVNSSSSVITSDFVDRLRKKKLSDAARVRLARWSSVAIGAVVVAMSLYVSIVPGNIFELCFKIVNLLVGPLFLLFFLAFFVRRAGPISAWLGVISGSATAILIGFWEQIFGTQPPISFVWLTPLSFGAGLGVALVVGMVKTTESTGDSEIE